MQEAISPRERLAATAVNEKCRLGSVVIDTRFWMTRWVKSKTNMRSRELDSLVHKNAVL